jgi:molybdopterin molybdotransferase
MAISYDTALELIRTAACDAIASSAEETMSLCEAAGRIAAYEVTSPVSSPAHDTSAMDGYAIRSSSTLYASLEHPVLFRVEGTLAAGKQLQLFDGNDKQDGMINGNRSQDGNTEPALEIMTGARFSTDGPYADLDACVRLEDVQYGAMNNTAQGHNNKPAAIISTNSGSFSNRARVIAVTAPVRPNSNRRSAGTDIQAGAVLVRAGQRIGATHIMPLAAVGIRSVAVRRRPRVGIWSTGTEILGDEGGDTDVNGPFLVGALRAMACDAVFLGVLDDDPNKIADAVRAHAAADDADDQTAAGFDMLVTTGGVSVGKFDFVRSALEGLEAEIVFHGVKIRPGHPVLFALLPTATSPGKIGCRPVRMPVFGLPGNPGAAAACFRFLVVPFLRCLLRQDEEQPMPAQLLKTDPMSNGHHGLAENGRSAATQVLDCFRPGMQSVTSRGEVVVADVGKGKGTSMLSSFAVANCWIHIPPALKNGEEDQLALCYPMSGGWDEILSVSHRPHEKKPV